MLSAILTSLFAVAPLQDVVPAEPILWVWAPDVRTGMTDLTTSSWRGLAKAALPESARKLMMQQASTAAVAFYEGSGWSRLNEAVWIDGGQPEAPLADVLRRVLGQRGFTFGVPILQTENLQTQELRSSGGTATFFYGGGRVGWANERTWAQNALQKTPRPLTSESVFRSIQQQADDALLFGGIDFVRLWRFFARHPDAPQRTRFLTRLGMDTLRRGEFTTTLKDKSTLISKVTLVDEPPRRGLLNSFGPPLLVKWPANVPDTSVNFAALSVVPARIFLLVEQIVASMWPLEYTLARAEISAIEKQLGKKIGEDIFGHKPQQWTCHQGTLAEWSCYFPVADSDGARRFVSMVAQIAQNVFPQLRWRAVVQEGQTRYQLDVMGQQLHLGVANDGVRVASDPKLLNEKIRAKGQTIVPGAESALAFGVVNERRFLEAWWRAGRMGGWAQKVSSEIALSGVDKTSWILKDAPQSFVWESWSRGK